MPTILDSLVIQLGLDGRSVSKGASQSAASLKALEGRAEHTQGTLTDAGKAAADSFSRARVEALSLLAVFTGGRSLKAAFTEVTKANTQLANTSQNLNMDPKRLYAYGEVIKLMGGNAEDAAAAMKQMQALQYDPAQRGNLAKTMLSLGVTDYLDDKGNIRQDVLTRINRGIQSVDQNTRNHFLPQIGISSDAFKSALEQKPAQFDKNYEFGAQVAPTQKALNDARDLTNAYQKLNDEFSAQKRNAVSAWSHGLTTILNTMEKWEQDNSGVVGGIAEISLAIKALITVAGGLGAVLAPLLMLRNGKRLKSLEQAILNGARTATADAPEVAEGLEKRGLPKLAASLGLRSLPIIGEVLAVKDGLTPVEANTGESQAVDRLRARGAFGPDPFGKYAQTIGQIESGGRYDIMGGSGGKYAGKYQMSRAAIDDAAKRLGEASPSTPDFLANPAMQERFFRSYTDQNRAYLMQDPLFRKLSADMQMAVLGYAHNQGGAGARRWLDGGPVAHDGFGTAATKYSDAIAASLNIPASQQVSNANTTNNHVHITVNGKADPDAITQAVQRGLHDAMPYDLTKTGNG